MIKQTLRQALTMMKQHKLFTGIYIAGTALSIATAMSIFVILYIKLGPLYPEKSRDRMVITDGVLFSDSADKEYVYSCRFKLGEAAEIIQNSKYIDKACIREYSSGSKKRYIISDDSKVEIKDDPVYTDCNFWKVFNFKFIHGRPFTKDEEKSAVAVVTETLAEKLYGRKDVVGRDVHIDTERYTIVGVVEKQGTCITNDISSGDIFASIHYRRYFTEEPGAVNNGYCNIIMVAESAAKRDSLIKETKETYGKLWQQNSYGHLSLDDVLIYKYWQKALELKPDNTVWDAILQYLYALLAFLFIPALNLSGMISSRMNSRLDEIGVRKAYGATNRQIVAQVLWENLLLTAVGAIIGLAVTYLTVYQCSDWILTIFDENIKPGTESVTVTFYALLNPAVIVAVLLLTILLNIASALIPTLLALKKEIVESLYNKR